MATTVQGGYRCITIAEISNLVALRTTKRISVTALRVYLAAHLLVASRYGAKRARFTVKELAQRLGPKTNLKLVERSLRELAKASVMIFDPDRITFTSEVLPDAELFARALKTSPRRPVPIPRYVLRALVRHTKATEVLVALVHLARCLFKRGQEIRTEGFVNAEWVSAVLNVSRRAVHNARRWLHQNGILRSLPVPQLVMNRWGARFEVVLPSLKPRRVKRKNAGLKRSLKILKVLT